ncbi:MAG: hypothetical protein VX899_26005 [Myxococcota bacterium]|nr:hypothetical protein [Myxococcota bacterium]
MHLSLFLSLVGCRGNLEINSAEDLINACEELKQEDETVNMTFLGHSDGCAWGEDGNGDRTQGVISARREDYQSMELPEGGVACDLQFDFYGLNPDLEQEITYDDHFMLTFNDVILASSSIEMMEDLEQSEEGWYVYDWEQIRGTTLEMQAETYCLGSDSDCEVPATETPGPIRLSFSGELVQQLGYLGVEQGRYDFGFITFGDNDDSDCYHEAFTFKVGVPVVYP